MSLSPERSENVRPPAVSPGTRERPVCDCPGHAPELTSLLGMVGAEIQRAHQTNQRQLEILMTLAADLARSAAEASAAVVAMSSSGSGTDDASALPWVDAPTPPVRRRRLRTALRENAIPVVVGLCIAAVAVALTVYLFSRSPL